MLRMAMLVLVLALGFSALAFLLGEKEAFVTRYVGGYFVYQAGGPGEAASPWYYAGGYFVY